MLPCHNLVHANFQKAKNTKTCIKGGKTDLHLAGQLGLAPVSVFVWLDVWVRVETTCSVTHSRPIKEAILQIG